MRQFDPGTRPGSASHVPQTPDPEDDQGVFLTILEQLRANEQMPWKPWQLRSWQRLPQYGELVAPRRARSASPRIFQADRAAAAGLTLSLLPHLPVITSPSCQRSPSPSRRHAPCLADHPRDAGLAPYFWIASEGRAPSATPASRSKSRNGRSNCGAIQAANSTASHKPAICRIQSRLLHRHAIDHQPILARRHLHRLAVMHLALQDHLGERVLHIFLDRALQRPGAIGRVVALLRLAIPWPYRRAQA